jgi:hypothetical protein
MKIKPDHVAHIKRVIANTNTSRDAVAAHYEFVRNEGRARDVGKRVRWDLAYAAGLSRWFCDNVYSYADDSHIDTALRSVMRDLYDV